MVDTSSLAIGIDIGGTKIGAALLDLSELVQRQPQDPIRHRSQLHRLPTPDTPEAFVDTIAQVALACLDEAGLPRSSGIPVGISTAGAVNPNLGEIFDSTGNLPAITYHPFPIARLVSAKTGLPVHAENDANAAAYGEYRSGAARGNETVVMITLGTGVGCGLVINGQMHRGRTFTAGEAGHMRISLTNDRRCTCGRIGCWEIFASGTGLAVTGQRELAEVPHSLDAQNLLINKDADELTTHDIIAGYKLQNPLAQMLMEKWHFFIATGLGNLMNVLDPDIVVIGGGMAQFVELPRLKKYLNERVMGNMDTTPIRMAELGNEAGLIGAAQLAAQRFASTPVMMS